MKIKISLLKMNVKEAAILEKNILLYYYRQISYILNLPSLIFENKCTSATVICLEMKPIKLSWRKFVRDQK